MKMASEESKPTPIKQMVISKQGLGELSIKNPDKTVVPLRLTHRRKRSITAVAK
jgi:hypothetical protein